MADFGNSNALRDLYRSEAWRELGMGSWSVKVLTDRRVRVYHAAADCKAAGRGVWEVMKLSELSSWGGCRGCGDALMDRLVPDQQEVVFALVDNRETLAQRWWTLALAGARMDGRAGLYIDREAKALIRDIDFGNDSVAGVVATSAWDPKCVLVDVLNEVLATGVWAFDGESVAFGVRDSSLERLEIIGIGSDSPWEDSWLSLRRKNWPVIDSEALCMGLSLCDGDAQRMPKALETVAGLLIADSNDMVTMK